MRRALFQMHFTCRINRQHNKLIGLGKLLRKGFLKLHGPCVTMRLKDGYNLAVRVRIPYGFQQCGNFCWVMSIIRQHSQRIRLMQDCLTPVDPREALQGFGILIEAHTVTCGESGQGILKIELAISLYQFCAFSQQST